MNKLLVLFFGAVILLGCSMNECRIKNIRTQYPGFSEDLVRRLASLQLEPGMSREMVVAALGRPDSVMPEGDLEVWVYDVWIITDYSQYKKPVYFVYFKDDKVVRTNGDSSRLHTLC